MDDKLHCFALHCYVRGPTSDQVRGPKSTLRKKPKIRKTYDIVRQLKKKES